MRQPRTFIIIIIALIVGAVVLTATRLKNPGQTNTNTIAKRCADHLQFCPDGSVVKRALPSCDFVACPKTEDDLAKDWKEFADAERGFSLRHPPDWTVSTNGETVVINPPAGPALNLRRAVDDTPLYEYSDHQVITIDGVSATQADAVTTEGTTRMIWVPQNDTWLTITWAHGDNDSPYYQVVSTLNLLP